KRVQQARAALRERLVRYFAGQPDLIQEIMEPDEMLRNEDAPAASAGPEARGNEELGARAVTLRAVEVRLPSGLAKDFLLFLPRDERRNPEARLAALNRYA